MTGGDGFFGVFIVFFPQSRNTAQETLDERHFCLFLIKRCQAETCVHSVLSNMTMASFEKKKARCTNQQLWSSDGAPHKHMTWKAAFLPFVQQTCDWCTDQMLCCARLFLVRIHRGHFTYLSPLLAWRVNPQCAFKHIMKWYSEYWLYLEPKAISCLCCGRCDPVGNWSLKV